MTPKKSTEERREHHNMLERRRRDHIRSSYDDLRGALTMLEGEKASRSLILNTACYFIQFMSAYYEGIEHEIEQINKQNLILEEEIYALENDFYNMEESYEMKPAVEEIIMKDILIQQKLCKLTEEKIKNRESEDKSENFEVNDDFLNLEYTKEELTKNINKTQDILSKKDVPPLAPLSGIFTGPSYAAQLPISNSNENHNNSNVLPKYEPISSSYKSKNNFSNNTSEDKYKQDLPRATEYTMRLSFKPRKNIDNLITNDIKFKKPVSKNPFYRNIYPVNNYKMSTPNSTSHNVFNSQIDRTVLNHQDNFYTKNFNNNKPDYNSTNIKDVISANATQNTRYNDTNECLEYNKINHIKDKEQINESSDQSKFNLESNQSINIPTSEKSILTDNNTTNSEMNAHNNNENNFQYSPINKIDINYSLIQSPIEPNNNLLIKSVEKSYSIPNNEEIIINKELPDNQLINDTTSNSLYTHSDSNILTDDKNQQENNLESILVTRINDINESTNIPNNQKYSSNANSPISSEKVNITTDSQNNITFDKNDCNKQNVKNINIENYKLPNITDQVAEKSINLTNKEKCSNDNQNIQINNNEITNTDNVITDLSLQNCNTEINLNESLLNNNQNKSNINNISSGYTNNYKPFRNHSKNVSIFNQLKAISTIEKQKRESYNKILGITKDQSQNSQIKKEYNTRNSNRKRQNNDN